MYMIRLHHTSGVPVTDAAGAWLVHYGNVADSERAKPGSANRAVKPVSKVDASMTTP